MVLEPCSIISGTCAAINSTVVLSRLVYEIKNTPVNIKTCLNLLARVDKDIQFVISLREKHLQHLSSNPEEMKRLDGIIAGATQSILDVGRLLEECKREAHGGHVPMRGTAKWVLRDSSAFERRTANFQQHHASINNEIAFLRQLETFQPIKDLLETITKTVFRESGATHDGEWNEIVLIFEL